MVREDALFVIEHKQWAIDFFRVFPGREDPLITTTHAVKNTEARLSNALLAALPKREYATLERQCELVSIEAGQILMDRGEIRHVYFPLSGVVTKLVRMGGGDQVHAGMVGNEGMVPLCLFLNLKATPFQAVVQNPGQALRMTARAFVGRVGATTALHQMLLRFAAAFMAQVSLSAACNRLHQLLPQFARWLLMTRDRLGADEFTLTQEAISEMLGVRRVSISAAAGELQRRGLIEYSRGRIWIVDGVGLEAVTCECYTRIKSTYTAMLKV